MGEDDPDEEDFLGGRRRAGLRSGALKSRVEVRAGLDREGGKMICTELIRDGSLREKVRLSRYSALHGDGRRLIRGWFERALEQRNCEAEESFEPFVFAYIALNGWASCVTTFDRDTAWRDALALDRRIGNDFSRLVADPSSPVGGPAWEFRRLWPVFQVQDLRRREIGHVAGDTRREIVDYYLGHPESGRLRFEPGCWRRHDEKGEEVPLDWPHTLAVLYRVRCNLFHGEKARHSEMDRRIVHASLRVLVEFFDSTGYLG